MPEEVAMEQTSYGNFIREAFIDPIRTVIVVDDEFPTLEALIDKETNPKDEKNWKPEDLRRAREIISFCREDDRKWMVEINDGQFQPDAGMDTAIAHLHQSDLLILDYHLDRDPAHQNDGERAIQILRHLARNDHFNLVVVYTNGEIAQVAREIAVGLSCRHPGMDMSEPALMAATQIVETLEDTDPGIADRLKASIDDAAYLMIKSRCDDKEKLLEVFDMPELQALRQLLDAAMPMPTQRERKQILRWTLHHRQHALSAQFGPDGVDDVKYHWNGDGPNWIRTERLFITVVGKNNAPKGLPAKMAAALEKWNPEPHRLLMSRMRAELDRNGVLAEGEILGNRSLQTGWLEEFLTEDPAARIWKIRNTVTRHWESLGDGIQKEVLTFSERLADHLLEEGREAAFANHAPLKPGEKRDEIALHMNRYVCSKEVDGHHLSTGHILRFVNGAQKSYWLCLSPACDLVPGRQATAGWPKRLRNFVTFTAVELFSVKPGAALANAPGGNYLFLDVADKVECFSFTPPLVGGDNELETRAANPKWEQMFADNQGRVDDSWQIKLCRIETDAEMKLTIFPTGAQVVAQLRYEYALNLLQRLGANLSRVGLDFIKPS